MNLKSQLIRLLASTCICMGAFMYLQSFAKPHKAKEAIRNANPKGEIRHIVCFKFKEGAEPAKIRKVEREFAALKGRISGIRSLEWGKNNSPEGLNKGFTHCFIVTFDNEESRTKYLPHPDHQAFVSILKPILDDVFVIDFNP
jgi:hypothetical protein